MSFTLDDKLVIAISSRALFDFEEENRVFQQGNPHAYMQYQLQRLEQAAQPGVAFPLVRKLLAFNNADTHLVEVVVLSRNDPVSGLRVFRSATHHDLALQRGVFTQGREPYGYLRPLRAKLFLSAEESDVRAALQASIPAARVYPHSRKRAESHPDEIRIAFDGDAVLFSDEAEQVFQRDGLPRFQAHESEKALQPLPPGPFKPLLEALHRLQALASPRGINTHRSPLDAALDVPALAAEAHAGGVPMRIRTALVTARSAPAHERAIRTLMNWNIAVDEAMFLGGLEKSAFLQEFEPDFFFDDQTGHCQSAAEVSPTGHVVSGIANARP